MKKKQVPFRIVACISLVVVLIVIIILQNRRSNSDSVNLQIGAESHLVTPAISTSVSTTKSEVLQPRDIAVKKLREHNESLTVAAKLKAPSREELNSVITENLKLSRKVLKTQNEKSLEREIFKNQEIIELTLSILDQPENEPLRMDAVEFLAKGLETQRRYGGENVAQQVSGFLKTDYADEALNPEQKKSIAADRVELYASLHHDFPQYADSVLDAASSEKLMRIYRFGKNFYSQK